MFRRVQASIGDLNWDLKLMWLGFPRVQSRQPWSIMNQACYPLGTGVSEGLKVGPLSLAVSCLKSRSWWGTDMSSTKAESLNSAIRNSLNMRNSEGWAGAVVTQSRSRMTESEVDHNNACFSPGSWFNESDLRHTAFNWSCEDLQNFSHMWDFLVTENDLIL